MTEVSEILGRVNRLSKREAAAFLGVEEHTLARWSKRGLCGVVLEQIRVGSRVFFTKQMLAEFQRAVDEQRRKRKANGNPIPVVILSDRERARRVREGREVLERMGLFRGKRQG